MTLDNRGTRPLTPRERRALAWLENSFADATPQARGQIVSDVARRRGRADRVAGVVGVLVLSGMVTEAAIGGGLVLALCVAAAFVALGSVLLRRLRGRSES